MNKTIIQIGSHVGNTSNDPIFNLINDTTTLVLVEPVPFLFRQLKANYNKLNNPNIFFINKAVSNFIGHIEMTIPSEANDFSRLPFWASQLASVDPNHATGHINGLLVEQISVETTTVNQIVEEFGITNIDLLHTDTEGHDYTILMDYNFKIKPKQILFEHKHMDGLLTVGDRYIELCDKLLSLGYTKMGQNSEDTLFQLN
jgi:FkbM family methyltransferase